jgi:hypothetical protein
VVDLGFYRERAEAGERRQRPVKGGTFVGYARCGSFDEESKPKDGCISAQLSSLSGLLIRGKIALGSSPQSQKQWSDMIAARKQKFCRGLTWIGTQSTRRALNDRYSN